MAIVFLLASLIALVLSLVILFHTVRTNIPFYRTPYILSCTPINKERLQKDLNLRTCTADDSSPQAKSGFQTHFQYEISEETLSTRHHKS